MYRLFAALRPPAEIRDLLADTMDGVPGARWQDDAQLHCTLRFIGSVDGGAAEDAAIALSQLFADAPTVRLAGVGSFARRGAAHSLWAGLAPAAPLAALHAKVDRALIAAGVDDGEHLRFQPHVTIARLSRTDGMHPAVADWQRRHANLSSAAFTMTRLILYESVLLPGGAHYETRAAWPLHTRDQAG